MRADIGMSVRHGSCYLCSAGTQIRPVESLDRPFVVGNAHHKRPDSNRAFPQEEIARCDKTIKSLPLEGKVAKPQVLTDEVVAERILNADYSEETRPDSEPCFSIREASAPILSEHFIEKLLFVFRWNTNKADRGFQETINAKIKGTPQRGVPFILVPVAGLEPARCRHRWILSPLRLPIPSHRHLVLVYCSTGLRKMQPPILSFCAVRMQRRKSAPRRTETLPCR